MEMDMEEDKQLEILLDDPKQEEKKDEPVVVVEGEDAPLAAQNDDGDPVAALKKMEEKLKREKKKSERSERERERAEQIAQQAMAEAGENRRHVMVAALNQVKMDTDRLMNEYAEAMSINNFDEAAKIQAQMSQNAVRAAQFEAEIDNFRRQEAPAQSGSQLDQIIKSVSPESARWLKQNREHLNDDKAIRRMFRAHEDAVDDGIKPDSNEYFEFIEKRLGITDDYEEPAPKRRKQEEQDDDEPMSTAAKPAARSAPPPPAPVERYGNRPNVVRLSRAEAETAKMLGMTEKEYATHKLALQKEGKLAN